MGHRECPADEGCAEMMRARLNEALRQALERRDEVAVTTLRLILAALKDRDLAARGRGAADEGIADHEILDMLQEMVHQRREAIEVYEQGGNTELARREAEEIAYIEQFLPRQLGEPETTAAVDEVIGEVGAGGLKDMGRVMAVLRDRYAGRMDFVRASTIAKEHLR